MAEQREQEFLSLDLRPFGTDEESGSSPFDTLWTEFARSHPRLSPPRTPIHQHVRHVASVESSLVRTKPAIDLRTLEYISEYDSNLMCPICHAPFIDPVMLDCDHTFCGECFDEYRNAGTGTDRSKCPACRTYHLGGSRKVSRLIKNMCNDLRVRCPHEGCDIVTARGYIEHHVTKDCPEQDLTCPDSKCAMRTKRRNFVPDQCIHSSYIECDCGATIRLGRGEWLTHKDQHCSFTTGNLSPSVDLSHSSHSRTTSTLEPICPGAEFGCMDEVLQADLPSHVSSCPLARMAPHLRKQSQLLHTLTDQLKMAKHRNEVLETSFDRLHDLITTSIQPKLDHLTTAMNADNVSEIEEIPREDLHSLAHPRHNLSVLPAHLRELTPSPTQGLDLSHHDAHLLQTLDPRLANLENNMHGLQSSLSDLDARSTMALMNETLRIREELAQINGAMYSTRAQVQWLLNRERIIGQREAMAAGGAGMRGRSAVQGPSATGGSSSNATTSNVSVAAGSGVAGESASGQPHSASTSAATASILRPSTDRNMSSAWSSSQAQTAGISIGNASGPNSAATSPMFSAARPSLRRASGGSSQERVKL